MTLVIQPNRSITLLPPGFRCPQGKARLPHDIAERCLISQKLQNTTPVTVVPEGKSGFELDSQSTIGNGHAVNLDSARSRAAQLVTV